MFGVLYMQEKMADTNPRTSAYKKYSQSGEISSAKNLFMQMIHEITNVSGLNLNRQISASSVSEPPALLLCGTL